MLMTSPLCDCHLDAMGIKCYQRGEKLFCQCGLWYCQHESLSLGCIICLLFALFHQLSNRSLHPLEGFPLPSCPLSLSPALVPGGC